jgi:hypothetical protein
MIKKKAIPQPNYNVYQGDVLIGNCNEYEINDIRLQVVTNEEKDVWIDFNDTKIDINLMGNFSSYPLGFLDASIHAMTAIAKARIEKNKK